MATKVHVVQADVRIPDLTKAGSGITLKINYKDEDWEPSTERIGTLIIGHGGLHWTAGRKHKTKKISWGRFASMLED